MLPIRFVKFMDELTLTVENLPDGNVIPKMFTELYVQLNHLENKQIILNAVINHQKHIEMFAVSFFNILQSSTLLGTLIINGVKT